MINCTGGTWGRRVCSDTGERGARHAGLCKAESFNSSCGLDRSPSIRAPTLTSVATLQLRTPSQYHFLTRSSQQSGSGSGWRVVIFSACSPLNSVLPREYAAAARDSTHQRQRCSHVPMRRLKTCYGYRRSGWFKKTLRPLGFFLTCGLLVLACRLDYPDSLPLSKTALNHRHVNTSVMPPLSSFSDEDSDRQLCARQSRNKPLRATMVSRNLFPSTPVAPWHLRPSPSYYRSHSQFIVTSTHCCNMTGRATITQSSINTL